MRVHILIWFQNCLLFTKPHFQTFNALKSTSFQIILDFFSQTLSHRVEETHRLRARRALTLFKDVPFRPRRTLMPYALCTAIAPFWFPKDLLMPFCLSNDRDIFMITSDNCSIDLFTNVSQIYGCFFPRDLVTSHFINLYLTMVFQYLETTLLLYRTNLGQAFRLSGITFVKMVYRMHKISEPVY